MFGPLAAVEISAGHAAFYELVMQLELGDCAIDLLGNAFHVSVDSGEIVIEAFVGRVEEVLVVIALGPDLAEGSHRGITVWILSTTAISPQVGQNFASL